MKVAIVLTAVIFSVHASNVKRAGWGSTVGWNPPTVPPTTQPPAAGWNAPPPGWNAPPPTSSPAGWNAPPPTSSPAGWNAPPPTSSPAGWNAPPPTSPPAGWNAPPPTSPPAGWNAPPPAGWNAPPAGWNAQSPPGWNAPSNLTIDLTGNLTAIGQGWAGSNHAETVSASGDDNTPANVNVVSIGDALVEQYGSIAQATQNNGTSGASVNSVYFDQDSLGSESLLAHAQGLQANLSQSGWSGATGAGASSVDALSHLQGN